MGVETIRLSARKRLGLLPFDSLTGQRCSLSDHAYFTTDPIFPPASSTNVPTSLQRHNNLVWVVQGNQLWLFGHP
jgi:hypothetical protein